MSSKETLASFWQEYLSKNGKIPALMKNLRTVAPEERPAMGKIVNELKAKAVSYTHLTKRPPFWTRWMPALPSRGWKT